MSGYMSVSVSPSRMNNVSDFIEGMKTVGRHHRYYIPYGRTILGKRGWMGRDG